MTAVALVHGVGVRALEWLHAHRDGFRLERDDDPSTQLLGRFKPVGELALICKVLFRDGAAGSRQAALARQLLDHAWREVLDGGRRLEEGQHQEPLSPIPFEVYVPFRELGHSHPRLEESFRLTNRLGSWTALEMPPVRRLGLSALEQRCGLPPGVPLADAADRTWLGRTPEPWTVEDNIAYDVTHTVFHLTDWGEKPEGLPPAVADYLALWLPVWLDDWLDLQRWDLLGELLVVGACLPRPVLDEHVWAAFAAAQRPDGAMPVQGPDDPSEPDDPDEVFDALYHPTLVAAFASLLAASRAMAGLTADPA